MKDPKEIITIREGATYHLPTYVMESGTGLVDDAGLMLHFVKGAKDDESIFRQAGAITESVLQVALQYLRDVNKGQLQDDHTTKAIIHIEGALDELGERAAKRKARGVHQTYKS